MLKFFYPTAYYKRIYDIPLDMLKRNNIKGLIFDVDNTLSPYYQQEPDEETIAFIKRTINEGFSVCLLSNNSKKRITLYNKKLSIPCVPRAFKPSRKGLRKAISLMGAETHEVVIIGDQIFTDVWCGKRAGIRTILVEPCCERDEWIVRPKRGLEKIIVKSYLKSKEKNNC